jgi:hypothetical protein
MVEATHESVEDLVRYFRDEVGFPLGGDEKPVKKTKIAELVSSDTACGELSTGQISPNRIAIWFT